MHYLLVFLGGGLGSICRYGIGQLLLPWQGRYPWATLLANALACVVLGALTGWQLRGGLPAHYRLLLATGFCGGFSTFSTFTAEVWFLWQNGQAGAALWHVAANLAVCLISLLLGIKLASL